MGVPRVWEKINEKLVSIGRKSGSLKKYIADWAKEVGLNHYEDAMKGLVHLVLDIIIIKNVKKNIIFKSIPVSIIIFFYLSTLILFNPELFFHII